MKRKLCSSIENLASLLEKLLAIFLLMAVILGLRGALYTLVDIIKSTPLESFTLFQEFLGDILILVIGIEFIVLLINYNLSSLIEVLLFAIARKVLISSKSILDVFFGIIAIAILFAVNRYLMPKDKT